MKRLTFVVLALFVLTNAFAQSDKVYHGYLSGSTTLLKAAITELESQNAPAIDRLEAHYVLLNNTMSDQDEDTFDEYVDEAEELAEEILDRDKMHVKANALLGAIYGLKIAYSPMKGMFLGGKSSDLSAAGIKNAPENPISHLFFAMNKHNTPEMWGGDKALAMKHFRKAVEQFEAQGNTEQNWYYLNALAWLGIAERKAGNEETANAIFRKALEVEPNYGWAKGLLASR